MKRPWYDEINWPLFFSALALCTVGWLVLFSATDRNLARNSDAVRQAAYMGVGWLAIVVLTVVDYDVLARLVRPLYVLNVALLLLVVFVGHAAKGAQRWIGLGSFGTFQPSEPAKLLLIVTLSHALARDTTPPPSVAAADAPEPSRPRGAGASTLLRALVHVAIPFVLILIQPDLGTAMVLVAVLLALLFEVGISPVYLLGVLTAGLGVASAVLKQYQRNRLLVFLYPEADPRGMGYSLIQSRTAIGSGQLWGAGLFHGPMVGHHFVPEHFTDFIFANVGEELGLFGTVGIVSLYAVLILACVRAALAARDRFGTLICTGVAALLFFHVFINVGMTIGLMPVTGVPLPFLSYGGSALLTDLAACGLVGSVYRYARREYIPSWQ